MSVDAAYDDKNCVALALQRVCYCESQVPTPDGVTKCLRSSSSCSWSSVVAVVVVVVVEVVVVVVILGKVSFAVCEKVSMPRFN